MSVLFLIQSFPHVCLETGIPLAVIILRILKDIERDMAAKRLGNSGRSWADLVVSALLLLEILIKRNAVGSVSEEQDQGDSATATAVAFASQLIQADFCKGLSLIQLLCRRYSYLITAGG